MQEHKDKKDNLLLPAIAKTPSLFGARRVSFRWLIAIIAMGLMASIFLATALFTTTNGRIQLSKLAHIGNKIIFVAKNEPKDRLSPIVPLQRFGLKKEIDLGVSQKDFGGSVIKPQKFELVHLSLAEVNSGRFKYPAFNALSLFDNSASNTENTTIDGLYNGKVGEEIIFKKEAFEPSNVSFAQNDKLTDTESALHIHKSFNRFNDGSVTVDNIILNYVKNDEANKNRILSDKNPQINISYLHKGASNDNIYNYTEDLIPLRSGSSILDSLRIAHYSDNFAKKAAIALGNIIPAEKVQKGGVIRLGLETEENGTENIIRASLYEHAQHIATVALNDDDIFVEAQEPETTTTISKYLSGHIPNVSNLDGRTIALYDSIYRTALNYALSPKLIKQLLHIIAADVDLQSPTKNNDSLNIFFPIKNDSKEEGDIIYIEASIGDKTHKYYRYKAIDGRVEYYNAEGKSPKQFLLRKPVPNAHFSSPFGARRHPILGSVRMHTGVDWAAPLHSVIIAAGDGIVTKMGPTPGYGNHTEIQHANGYMSSYSHQSGFAAGIHPGAHVHQGQVIGYIGSTGLSTGAHCHFEIVVNGIKTNPMRVHLPNSRILKGRDLLLFAQKRKSIDATLNAHKI